MGLLICVAVNEHNNRNKSACSCGSQSLLIGYPQSTCSRQDTGKLKDNNSHTIVYKMCICTWGFMIYLHICLNVMCVCVSFCVCVYVLVLWHTHSLSGCCHGGLPPRSPSAVGSRPMSSWWISGWHSHISPIKAQEKQTFISCNPPTHKELI